MPYLFSVNNHTRNSLFLYLIGGLVVLASVFLFSFIETKDTLSYTGRDLQLDDNAIDEARYPTTKISFNHDSCLQIETVNHLKTGTKNIYTVSRAELRPSETPTECANPNSTAFNKIELNGSLNFHFQKYSVSSDLNGESVMFNVTVESFNGLLETQSCKKIEPDFTVGVHGIAEFAETHQAKSRESFLQRLRNRFKSL